MLQATELRKGTVYIMGNDPYLTLDYKHIKTARGSATVKVKVKNLKNGVIKEETYKTSDRVEEADISKRNMAFLYTDSEGAFFMDNKTFEQTIIPLPLVKEVKADRFLKDGMVCLLTFFGEEPINLELPKKYEYTVTYTEPGFAGNTTSNTGKDAIIDTSAQVKVPLFIKQGEKIIVDTSTGDYVSRA